MASQRDWRNLSLDDLFEDWRPGNPQFDDAFFAVNPSGEDYLQQLEVDSTSEVDHHQHQQHPVMAGALNEDENPQPAPYQNTMQGIPYAGAHDLELHPRNHADYTNGNALRETNGLDSNERAMLFHANGQNHPNASHPAAFSQPAATEGQMNPMSNTQATENAQNSLAEARQAQPTSSPSEETVQSVSPTEQSLEEPKAEIQRGKGGKHVHTAFEQDPQAKNFTFGNTTPTAQQAKARLNANRKFQHGRKIDDHQACRANQHNYTKRLFESLDLLWDDAPEDWKDFQKAHYENGQNNACIDINNRFCTIQECEWAKAQISLVVDSLLEMHENGGIPQRVFYNSRKFKKLAPEAQLICSERLQLVIDAVERNKLIGLALLDNDGVDDIIHAPAGSLKRRLENARTNAKKATKMTFAKEHMGKTRQPMPTPAPSASPQQQVQPDAQANEQAKRSAEVLSEDEAPMAQEPPSKKRRRPRQATEGPNMVQGFNSEVHEGQNTPSMNMSDRVRQWQAQAAQAEQHRVSESNAPQFDNTVPGHSYGGQWSAGNGPGAQHMGTMGTMRQILHQAAMGQQHMPAQAVQFHQRMPQQMTMPPPPTGRPLVSEHQKIQDRHSSASYSDQQTHGGHPNQRKPHNSTYSATPMPQQQSSIHVDNIVQAQQIHELHKAPRGQAAQQEQNTMGQSQVQGQFIGARHARPQFNHQQPASYACSVPEPFGSFRPLNASIGHNSGGTQNGEVQNGGVRNARFEAGEGIPNGAVQYYGSIPTSTAPNPGQEFSNLMQAMNDNEFDWEGMSKYLDSINGGGGGGDLDFGVGGNDEDGF